MRRAAVVAVAATLAVVPLPRAAVERWYSQGMYAALQPPMTSASNRAPLALLDVLIAAAIVGWIAPTIVDVLRGRRVLRVVGRTIARGLVIAAGGYIAFLLLWGFNYRRVPLANKLEFDETRVTADAARSLASTAVDRLNALHDDAQAAASETRGIDPALAGAFAEVQRQLGDRRAAAPGRPKYTLLDLYFRRVGADGMTDPYFLETLIASDLLPFERSFVVAHEWSHLAGFADEGEANFVGWLTCLHAPVGPQYSAWLFLYGELAPTLSGAERGSIAARLGPGPRDDLRAIAARYARNISRPVSRIGWRVYDRYLKANRIEAGAASYAEVLRLALGTRFGPEWTPALHGR